MAPWRQALTMVAADKTYFTEKQRRSQTQPVLAVERSVCGCDYGATSWATRDEVDSLIAKLALRPGVRLLDVGAGTGWPAIYLARESGCDVTLTDVPFGGLRVAAERAAAENLAGDCRVAAADGASLPFADASFDAISHSDVLCCLPDKRGVLKACRRVVAPGGRMVFSVIYITPGLSVAAYERAVEAGPPFVEMESDYRSLLGRTGWEILETVDMTRQFTASINDTINAMEAERDSLEAAHGKAEFADRRARLRMKQAAMANDLLRREIFVATPGQAS